MLEQVQEELCERIVLGEPTLTVATDCSLALATLPAVAAVNPTARVLWLDAHSDYDTPETSTIGFLGCMSLAGATGAWSSGLGIRCRPTGWCWPAFAEGWMSSTGPVGRRPTPRRSR